MHGLQEAEQMDLQGPFTYAIYGPNVGQVTGNGWYCFLDVYSGNS